MINDQTLDRIIGERLVAANTAERAAHQSSYKLSASSLGLPTQWQILKTLGVDQVPLDEYTLRKFQRGKDVEKWLVDHMPGRIIRADGSQHFVEFAGAIGYVDAIIDTSQGYEFNLGTIPHEIKSVSNAKFKRINQVGQADKAHRLQATLYALALNAKHYAIDYVATDDLRVRTFIYDTDDLALEVAKTIADYDWCIESEVVPVFTAKADWQSNAKYMQYADWSTLTFEEVNERIKKEYPDAWKTLKGRTK